MGPYYDEAGIRIFHGDCEAVMATLPAGSVDLVFTSPPYNLGNTTGGGFPDRFGHYRKSTGLAGRGGGMKSGKWDMGALANGYDEHDDAMQHEEYIAWQQRVLRACWRLLGPRGAIFYNHKPRILDGQLMTPFELIPPELLPYRRQVVIWKRSGGINFTPSHYVSMHEWIVIIARREFRLRDKPASGADDVWEVHQDTNNPHPAPFPIGLPARAIETTTAQIILDPFCGSGTTLRAARNAGRHAVGIDTSEKYCRQAAERLAQLALNLDAACAD